jgi:hypothetical protein
MFPVFFLVPFSKVEKEPGEGWNPSSPVRAAKYNISVALYF